MSSTPSWAEVIREAMAARVGDVHTALPAQVMAYDPTAQTVDVQPLVQNVLRDPDTGNSIVESFPQIPAVPVAFPRAGDNWITFPIAVGDTVLLVFCERSIDNWRTLDRESDPGHLRVHDLSDAVAIPGVYATPKAVTTSATACVFNVVSELHLGGLNPIEFVALATKTQNEITALRNTVNALVTAFNSHMHATAAVGPPSIPTPAAGIPASAPAAVGAVAAAKVKAL